MVALVSVETVLLVLLTVLVAGLLRSHAELLRRVGAPDESPTDGTAGARAADPQSSHAAPVDEFEPGLRAPPSGSRDVRPPAITGTTLAGDAVKLDFDGMASAPTLLAFLSSGCSTCAPFWETFGSEALPPGLQAVIVTRSGDRERPARLRSLAPEEIPVLMSSAAWEDYEVPGSPYFVLVDGTIRGEGVASTWEGLSSLVSDALADEDLELRASAGTRRARQVDATLAAHGILPGHPSLYPGRREE